MSNQALKGGPWRPREVNDLFRFYHYRAGEGEDHPHPDATGGGADEDFPIHRDNSTARSPTDKSFFTVLVYLSGGFEGGGGATTFYGNSDAGAVTGAGAGGGAAGEQLAQQQGHPEMARVHPLEGDILVFPHEHSECSLLHAGLRLAPGSADEKLVLRTDVMCTGQHPFMEWFPLAAPFAQATEVNRAWQAGFMAKMARLCR